MNSNDLAGRFIRYNCKQIGRFSIFLPTMEKFTNASVVSRSESEEVDLLAGPNISILPGLQSSKLTKRRQPNTTSKEKQGKFDVEAIADVEYSLSKN